MLSVLGSSSVYAKLVSVKLATPLHCFHLPNTVNSLKCSPKLQFGCTPSSQRNCFKIFCKRKEQVTPFSQEFSALQEDDSPWESGSVWSNLALYLFTLHIPFSFGGLSVVALFNGQPVLDPQTEALLLLTIQILELSVALVLLNYTAKPQYKFSNFFKKNKFLSNRNWFLSSALGFGFLVLLVFLTSLLAEQLLGSKTQMMQAGNRDATKELKNTQFPMCKEFVRMKKVMSCKLYKAVESENVDNFVDVLKQECTRWKLCLCDIFGHVTETGDSLLHMAAEMGEERIVELICDHFLELVIRRNNIRGDTVLHAAVRSKNSKVVKFILSQYDIANCQIQLLYTIYNS